MVVKLVFSLNAAVGSPEADTVKQKTGNMVLLPNALFRGWHEKCPVKQHRDV